MWNLCRGYICAFIFILTCHQVISTIGGLEKVLYTPGLITVELTNGISLWTMNNIAPLKLFISKLCSSRLQKYQNEIMNMLAILKCGCIYCCFIVRIWCILVVYNQYSYIPSPISPVWPGRPCRCVWQGNKPDLTHCHCCLCFLVWGCHTIWQRNPMICQQLISCWKM